MDAAYHGARRNATQGGELRGNLPGAASRAVLPFHGADDRADDAMEGCLNLQSRLESLKGRHTALELRIADEDHRPRPDSDALAKLKLEKLRLKEEITRISKE